MAKPATLEGYGDEYTVDCERVLVTLLRGLGHQVAEISAELLGGNGVATERVKHADIVSFTCLRAFAFDQRFERKDAHDLVYCIEHAPEGLDAVVAAFARALAGKHAAVVRDALDILRRRFADEEATEGYRKDGPVAVAKFELGDGDEPEQREARTLRQREVSDMIGRLLAGTGGGCEAESSSSMPALHARTPTLVVASGSHSPSFGCALRLDRRRFGASFGHS